MIDNRQGHLFDLNVTPPPSPPAPPPFPVLQNLRPPPYECVFFDPSDREIMEKYLIPKLNNQPTPPNRNLLVTYTVPDLIELVTHQVHLNPNPYFKPNSQWFFLDRGVSDPMRLGTSHKFKRFAASNVTVASVQGGQDIIGVKRTLKLMRIRLGGPVAKTGYTMTEYRKSEEEFSMVVCLLKYDPNERENGPDPLALPPPPPPAPRRRGPVVHPPAPARRARGPVVQLSAPASGQRGPVVPPAVQLPARAHGQREPVVRPVVRPVVQPPAPPARRAPGRRGPVVPPVVRPLALPPLPANCRGRRGRVVQQPQLPEV